VERREYIKLAGMASVAATAGLAGCSDDEGSGGDGDGTEDGTPENGNGDASAGALARYDQWVYADASEAAETTAISVDLTQVAEDESEEEGGDETQDPLATTPLGFLFIAGFAAGFGTFGTGLDGFAEEESGTEQFHIASGGVIFEGNYDASSLTTDVEDAGGTEQESYGGYTLYYNDSGQNPNAVALSDDVVILVSDSDDDEVDDPLARVKDLVDTGNGDKTLLSEESDRFADLASALPDRGVMGVAFSEEAEALNEGESGDDFAFFGDTDLSGRGNGLATSADFNDDRSLDSSLALRYENESEVDDREDIESAIGTDADEQSVSIDGPLVVVEGSYEEVPSIPEE